MFENKHCSTLTILILLIKFLNVCLSYKKKLRIKQQTIFTSALFEIQPFLTVYEMRLLHWEKKNKQNKKIKKKTLYLKEPHIDFKYLRN